MRLQKRIEEIGEHLRRFAAEEEILTAAGLGRWERVFARLDAMDRPMNRDAAGQCLEWALHNAPAPVFARLLDRLPGGEYVGRAFIRRMPGGRRTNHCTEVRGSLTLLAAACGKREHLKCLLDRGWDVNSASPDAARSLRARVSGHYVHQMVMPMPGEPYSARHESMLRVMEENEMGLPAQFYRLTFWGATPLAAAVACGRTGCARLLMARGAWREEAPSVARALMMRDREEDGRYQACRRAVLAEGGVPRPMALWAVIQNCSPEQLDEELRRLPYSAGELAEAVCGLLGGGQMSPGIWWEDRKEDDARLRVLARHAPSVFRQEKQACLLLRWGIVHDESEELLDFLTELLPERVNLSLLQETLLFRPVKKVCALLHRVCQGRTCVMDRDSVPPRTPPLVLQTLLKYVTFLPPSSARGVSGLSRSLLSCGNLRLIRKALESGTIPPEEDTGDLLRCQEKDGAPKAVRALLLSVRRPDGAGVRPEPGKVLSGGLLFRWLPEENRSYLALLDRDCPEAEERELVARGLYEGRRDLTWETKDGVWHANSPLALMCFAGRVRGVERWVRCGQKDVLREIYTLRPEGKDYELAGTGLCIAAFAGQRQTVETLLELGAEAEEQHMGMPGLLRLSGGERELPVTPLLAALVRGRWETARLLLDHGAVCDLGQSAVKALWRVFRQDDMTEAVERHLHGYISRRGTRAVLTAKRA